MSRQEARGRAKVALTGCASKFLKPDGLAGVSEQKNGERPAAGKNNEDELNDFVLCLGYLPYQIGKPAQIKKADQEEVNDFLLCLGYGSTEEMEPPDRKVERDQSRHNRGGET